MRKTLIVLGLLVMGACTSTSNRSTASSDNGAARYVPSPHEIRN